MSSPLDRPDVEREAWLFGAIAASDVAVFVVDGDGIVRVWGEGAVRLFGWPAADAVGTPLERLELVSDPVRLRRMREMSAKVLGGESWSGEWTARRRDGSAVPVSTVHQPLREAGGGVVGFV